MNDRWVVIHLGPEDGYGIATRRVKMLDLICRGMSQEDADQLCELLNKTTPRPPRRD